MIPLLILCFVLIFVAYRVLISTRLVSSLSVSEFSKRLQGAKKPQLLDVRTKMEFDQGHLKGAKHIPMRDLGARLAELTPGPLFLYCRSGHRSAMAARF